MRCGALNREGGVPNCASSKLHRKATVGTARSMSGRKQGRQDCEDRADGRFNRARRASLRRPSRSESAAKRMTAMQSRGAPDRSRRKLASKGALRGIPRWKGERETLRLLRGERLFPTAARIWML